MLIVIHSGFALCGNNTCDAALEFRQKELN